MRTTNGAFLISRSIYDSGIWRKPPEWLKIWLYLLGNVNFEDNNLFKRGENFFKYEVIALSCDVSINTVNKCIKYLITAEQIQSRKTSRGAILSINNYDTYQNMGNYGRTEAEQKQNRSRTGTNTITEEGKNEIMKETNTDVFDLFWNSYPVKQGKKKAREVYKKLEREHDAIMLGLQRHIKYWSQRGKTTEFIPNTPHATTFLNERRWEDELDIKEEKKQSYNPL